MTDADRLLRVAVAAAEQERDRIADWLENESLGYRDDGWNRVADSYAAAARDIRNGAHVLGES